MDKKGIAEIKRRLKKENCTIQHISGCYVDSDKNKLVTFSRRFLTLEEEEFYKYLDIAAKALSGAPGDHLLTLSFPLEEEASGGRQQILMGLRDSRLENEDLLDAFYDLIIDTYDYVGNYLITLFYDVYDVPLKGTDDLAMHESDEVYEYLLCCICPVALSKPGLGYLESEGRIGARIRDWVVGATDSAFLFPAFEERSADIHQVLVYTKNAKEPHTEFWENGLGCPVQQTSTQKRSAFSSMVTSTLGPDRESTAETVLDLQQNLNDFLLLEEEKNGKDEPVALDAETVEDLLTDSGVNEPDARKISGQYAEMFDGCLPEARELLDTKALHSNEGRAEKKQLQKQVAELTQRLADAGMDAEDGTEIFVNVPPEKAKQVTSAYVDGSRCLIIPLDENDRAKINGKEADL